MSFKLLLEDGNLPWLCRYRIEQTNTGTRQSSGLEFFICLTKLE
jgi:hypothetical protein